MDAVQKKFDAFVDFARLKRLKSAEEEGVFSMATIRFTQNIQRHVACPTCEAAGSTLRTVLDEYFRENEKARGYVLDEQGKIRQHMVVFIDGELVRDRDSLSDRVEPNSMIDVIQALSGG